MQKSDAETHRDLAASFTRFQTFLFALRIGMMISQGICLLAVTGPNMWMIWALIARWIYVVPPVVYLLALISGKPNSTDASAPKRQSWVWLFIGALFNVATIVALFGDRFDVVLLVGFGWNALSAMWKRLFPGKQPDAKEDEPVESSRLKWERFQRVDSVIQPIIFCPAGCCY